MRQWGSDAGEERRAFEPGKGVDQDDLRACQASPEHGKEHCPSAGRNQHGRTFAQDDHGRQHEIAKAVPQHSERSAQTRLAHRDMRYEKAAIMFGQRSEEHTSELQSLMRDSYAVFCLKKTKYNKNHNEKTRD